MVAMIYLFDTNAVTDLMRVHANVVARVRANRDHILCLCQPVDYEIQRGLLWKAATGQQHRYQNQIKSQFSWLPLTDDDWRQSAQFWAVTRSVGKQLSDVDLLVAALAKRLDAVIVSSDEDFNALPVKRENWRDPLPQNGEQ